MPSIFNELLNSRKRKIRISLLLLIGLGFFAFKCAPTRMELGNKGIDDLKDLWLKSDNLDTRIEIVQELESRKATDALTFCLPLAAKIYYSYPYRQQGRFELQDCLVIIKALGKLKHTGAIGSLGDVASRRLPIKEIKMAVLIAYKEIGSSKAIFPAKELLGDADHDVRWQAIDTLANIMDSGNMDSIFPALYDKSPDIRWKAVQALGEIGNTKAVDRISLLLADKDDSVRGISESVLRELGVPKERITDLKRKAEELRGQHLSLEDVYRSKLAYQKAVMEKEALKVKLESEADVKRQLRATLQEREDALKRKDSLVASLYEKERQLKSKLFQLEQAQKDTEKNREELDRINKRVEEINKEFGEKKDLSESSVKEELDGIIKAKSKLELEADSLRNKEIKLKDEVNSLRTFAEKTRTEAEDAKKQLATMRERETELIRQVDSLKKRLDRGMAPVLVISRPKNGTTTQSPVTVLNVIIVDDKGIDNLSITLNGKPIKLGIERGVEISAIGKRGITNKMNITERLPLERGENRILVSARDIDGMTAEEMVTVTREKERGKIWAIVIGINQYQNTRKLKYAVNDALSFKDYLKEHLGLTEESIFFIKDGGATQANIKSLLGTTIKRKASKEDTVIIFYAGHGAVETDPLNPDGDGFEKYLLPYDANLDDLYSTAIAMGEIKKIFHRIRAERLIFIADTCYSGASGGRTMLASKTRATLSEKFFERISKGKGRVIISACSANEISKEDDRLEHGVFTYYLLKGLKGGADFDGDGIITVSEIFGFLSKKVPEASGQDQHPVRKGETEGELVIGRVK